MSLVILKRHAHCYKNRLFERSRVFPHLNREFLVLLLIIIAMLGLYQGTVLGLHHLQVRSTLGRETASGIISICSFAFFILLMFSNCVAAIGFLFNSRDTSLLLSMPITRWELYSSRLIEICLTSSWMVLFFCVPSLLACYQVYNLPLSFLFISLLVLIPYLVIPAGLGSFLATLLVTVLPAHRVRDLLALVAFAVVCLILYFGNAAETDTALNDEIMKDLLRSAALAEQRTFFWLPSQWAYDILSSYFLHQETRVLTSALLLFTTMLGSVALGFLTFEYLFPRTWSISQNSRLRKPKYSPQHKLLFRVFLPCNPQFRALLSKEAKMFVRDTTQSLQLLFLLLLSLISLYNFRALRTVTSLSTEGYSWWQAVLSAANILISAVVIAAISARFVFPSVSMEGQTYTLVRMSPMTIEQFLAKKFFIWLWPVMILALVLLLSGSWAIFGSPQSVFSTAIFAVALSVGIVGLGIGVGAVYARFDWESPTQVVTSFGSLVFMLLSLATICLTLIPGVYVFVLTCVPGFSQLMTPRQFNLSMFFAYAGIIFINFATARQALMAGAQSLKSMER